MYHRLPIKIRVKHPQRLALPLTNEVVRFECVNPLWLCNRLIAEHDHLVKLDRHMLHVELCDEVILESCHSHIHVIYMAQLHVTSMSCTCAYHATFTCHIHGMTHACHVCHVLAALHRLE